MQGKTIALLESRLGAQLAELITRHGGIPLLAPALAEEADVDDTFIVHFISELETRPAKLAIFQTAVGTRALFEATDRLGFTVQFVAALSQMLVLARGPKPGGVLRQRGIRIDLNAADPFTSEEILAALEDVSLAGQGVLVQRYGATNEKLDHALERRGATVIEIPTYRWAMPRDTAPMRRLIEALARGEVDAAVFTNAAQADNLFAVAREQGREQGLAADLNRTLVASVGPVCSAALVRHGIGVALEAHPPKLGPLISLLVERLSL